MIYPSMKGKSRFPGFNLRGGHIIHVIQNLFVGEVGKTGIERPAKILKRTDNVSARVLLHFANQSLGYSAIRNLESLCYWSDDT